MTDRKTKAAEIDHYVGIRLRALRVMAGLTQGEVAHMLGCAAQQIDRYERGAKRLSAGRLLEFARVLGVTVEDLFHGIDGLGQPRHPACTVLPLPGIPTAAAVPPGEDTSAQVCRRHLHSLHTLARALGTTH